MRDNPSEMAPWEQRFATFLTDGDATFDGAHDMSHVRRVVANARRLAAGEGADLAVVIPAAWLHDCVSPPKDSPLRRQASRLAAAKAADFLAEAGYPDEYIPAIRHAIEAHSFSAGIPAETLEARVVQDADRLDALGAVGIARCLITGAALGRSLYDIDDPFAAERPPDDRRGSVDHFYTKLFKLPALMQTDAGRREAERRAAFMHHYLAQLADEIGAER